MGTTYVATAVIGVTVDLARLEARFAVTNPSCPHSERVGQRFCPVCGTKVGDRTDFSAYDALQGIVSSLPQGFVATEHSYTSEVAVGYGVAADSYGKSVVSRALPDIAATAATLKAVLEPLGLWDEARFGLHAVIDAF